MVLDLSSNLRIVQAYFGHTSDYFRYTCRPPSWNLVTVEDWSKEIFPKGVSVKWKNWQDGRGRGS